MKKVLIPLLISTLIISSCWNSETRNETVKNESNNIKTSKVDEDTPIYSPNSAEMWEKPTSIKPDVLKDYTIEEISKHNTKEDCYSVVEWKVYNFTTYFWKHPWWDDTILKMCWIDGTKDFQMIHSHSEKAKNDLELFLIWNLK